MNSEIKSLANVVPSLDRDVLSLINHYVDNIKFKKSYPEGLRNKTIPLIIRFTRSSGLAIHRFGKYRMKRLFKMLSQLTNYDRKFRAHKRRYGVKGFHKHKITGVEINLADRVVSVVSPSKFGNYNSVFMMDIIPDLSAQDIVDIVVKHSGKKNRKECKRNACLRLKNIFWPKGKSSNLI